MIIDAINRVREGGVGSSKAHRRISGQQSCLSEMEAGFVLSGVLIRPAISAIEVRLSRAVGLMSRPLQASYPST